MIQRHEIEDAATGIHTTAVRVVEGLTETHPPIPADGVSAAVLNYAAPGPAGHTWTVSRPGSSTSTTEPAALDPDSGLYWSEIEVVATEPGPIEVTVGGSTITIEAT